MSNSAKGDASQNKAKEEKIWYVQVKVGRLTSGMYTHTVYRYYSVGMTRDKYLKIQLGEVIDFTNGGFCNGFGNYFLFTDSRAGTFFSRTLEGEVIGKKPQVLQKSDSSPVETKVQQRLWRFAYQYTHAAKIGTEFAERYLDEDFQFTKEEIGYLEIEFRDKGRYVYTDVKIHSWSPFDVYAEKK
jgi:hypothetical protein